MSWGVHHLTVRFGGRTALDDVSIETAPGRVTGVVGGDGAGKTTLLRALAGALSPGEGAVRRPEARQIGYLPPSSGTYPDLSVEENLAFSASAYGVKPSDARGRTAEALERTGLAQVRGRLVGKLSGGMRKKLGVIRAMLHHPALLVLDEPTTGVDPVSRIDLWWLISRATSEGAAVVLATTYLDEAGRASALLVLDAGRGLLEGTPGEIVKAVPGTVESTASRPPGEAGRRAWRRGPRWRVWHPDAPAEGTELSEWLEPDLQDAVTIAALRRELEQLPARERGL